MLVCYLLITLVDFYEALYACPAMRSDPTFVIFNSLWVIISLWCLLKLVRWEWRYKRLLYGTRVFPADRSWKISDNVPLQLQVDIWNIVCIQIINISIVLSRDSSVGIALGYGLDDRGCRVRVPEGTGNFSHHHRVQTCCGAHPASYPMDTRGFPWG
jgi:hypothetical protein